MKMDLPAPVSQIIFAWVFPCQFVECPRAAGLVAEALAIRQGDNIVKLAASVHHLTFVKELNFSINPEGITEDMYIGCPDRFETPAF